MTSERGPLSAHVRKAGLLVVLLMLFMSMFAAPTTAQAGPWVPTTPMVVIESPLYVTIFNTTTVELRWTIYLDPDVDHFDVTVKGEYADTEFHSIPPTERSLVINTWGDGIYRATVNAVNRNGSILSSPSMEFIVYTTSRPIAACSPAQGSVAPLNTTICVTFGQQMDRTSVRLLWNDGFVGPITWHVGPSSITDVTTWRSEALGEMTWHNDTLGDTLEVTPFAALTPGRHYSIEVMGYDQAKNFIMYNWSFTAFAGYCDLTGEVLDQDKHAVEGAKVTLDNGLTTTTGADGKFNFRNVLVRDYTITIEKSGYRTLTYDITDLHDGGEAYTSSCLEPEGGEPKGDAGTNLLTSNLDGASVVVIAIASAALVAVAGVYIWHRRLGG